jgi:hypothetical protein
MGDFPRQGTIAFWMYADEVVDYRNPFTTNFSGGNENVIRFEEQSPNSFVVIIGDASVANGYLYTSSLSAARWHHVVLVWDKDANNIRGYLNGVELINATNLNWPATLADVQIGRGYIGLDPNAWKGKLDELAIWERALQPAEIGIIYNNGVGIEIGVNCPPEQETTYYRDADGDGYGDSNDFIQACLAPPGYILDNTDCDDNKSGMNPGTDEICNNGFDDNCNGQVDELMCSPLPPLTSALKALYHMNDDWYDTSGNGYDGTTSNATFNSSAKLGSYAGNFEGGQYVIVGNMGVFPTKGTIAFWMYPEELADHRNPFATNFTGSKNGIRFEENSSGNFSVLIGGVIGSLEDVNSYLYTDSLSAAGWHHVVVVWDKDANNIRGYFNGVKIFNVTNSIWPDTLADVQIGRGYAPDGPAYGIRSWKGKLDELAIWGRALQPAEIDIIYNNGAGMEIFDCPPEQQTTYYRDADGDGYGDPNDSIHDACTPRSGYVLDNTDCDDTNASINPGLSEVCDLMDNNCDGNIDEGFDPDNDSLGDCLDNCPSTYNPDQTDTDGDGWGDVCDICPLSDGCNFPNVISYWKFDENEGDIVYDVTSNENDGAINGASWTSGKAAGALSFDGNDDYVNCGKDTTLDLGTGDFSICAWVKTSGDGIQMIMNKRSVNPEYPGYQLSIGSSGEARLGLFDGSQAYPNNFKEIASVIKINDGRWHFICGVADRFSSGYIYVDGQLNGSDNITNYSGSLDAPDANLHIGANQTGDNPFRGVIDEVIIYNKALSASEVLDRFITEGGTVDTTPPVFSGLESAVDNEDGETIDISWGTASDPSRPITYKIYYATEPGQQDFETPNSITQNNSYKITGLTKDQIYYIVVRAEDAFGNKESNTIELSVTPTKPCANPPCPVGYWKFDKGNGSTAFDETANHNDGTIVQASWITGKYGKALYFDGSRDFVRVESSPSLRITSDITVAAWFKISTNRSYQTIVSKTDIGGYQIGYDNESLYDNKLAFMVHTNGSYKHAGISVSEINLDTWYHVVGTYDGSMIKLYLNGILRASRSVTGNIKDTPDTCVFIGEEPNYCYPYDWSFGGVIDEVVIFDQALSALEVHDLYNNGVTQ